MVYRESEIRELRQSLEKEWKGKIGTKNTFKKDNKFKLKIVK